MKRYLLSIACMLCCCILSAQNVTVDFSVEKGPIKPLNGVNGGIQESSYAGSTTGYVRQANIPYFRTHDVQDIGWHGGPYLVDISWIFNDFDADVNDPASYDFYFTDQFIEQVYRSNSKIYYRLGQTIEDPNNPHHVFPPKDFKKWAQICEHIIRHYTDGWANGFHYDMKYWQIWNEYDATKPGGCWRGTDEEFHEFYEVAYRYLKKKFPHLQFGGPALIGRQSTAKVFVEAMAKRNVPLDFLSWHMYFHTVDAFKNNVRYFRNLLDENGYKDTPSFIDEWNIKPFDLTQSHYMTVLTASTMCVGQYEPIDMMLYYDLRIGSVFNNVFTRKAQPMPAYWAFYSWGRMSKLGTSVQTTSDNPEISVAAATNPNRTSSGILVSRLNVETGIPQLTDPTIRIPRSINPKEEVTIHIQGVKGEEVRAFMVDENCTYTPYPIKVEEVEDGYTVKMQMARMSFAYIEVR